MTTENKPPRRRPNEEVRGREHLTPDEVDRLRTAAASLGRYGPRDATMVFIAYRHALRVSELVGLRWDQVDLTVGTIYVRRRKGSRSGEHPLGRSELAALKKIKSDRKGHVFQNERGGPLSESGFHKIIARAGRVAGFTFPVHPHQLRHACGYKMANDGVDTRTIQVWMGHKNIQHTARYTEIAPGRLKGLWND